jgi:hypothetical protein
MAARLRHMVVDQSSTSLRTSNCRAWHKAAFDGSRWERLTALCPSVSPRDPDDRITVRLPHRRSDARRFAPKAAGVIATRIKRGRRRRDDRRRDMDDK